MADPLPPLPQNPADATEEKQSRLLIWMLGILLALIGVVALVEAPEEKSEEDEEWEKAFVGVTDTEVESVEIIKEGQSTLLARGAQGWELSGQVQGPADESRVDRLIDALVGLEVGEKDLGRDGLAQYGLEPAVAVVKATLKGGKTVEVQVGRDSPVGYRSYVRIKAEGPALVARSRLSDDLADPIALRSKELARFGAGSAERLAVQRGGISVVLDKDLHGWWVQGQLSIGAEMPRSRADEELVRRVLEQLQQLRADGPPVSAGALMTPELSFEIREGGQSQTLTFGADMEGQRLATAPLQPGVVPVRMGMLMEDLPGGAEGWLSTRLVPVRAVTADALTLKLGDRTIQGKREGAGWDAPGADVALAALQEVRVDRTRPAGTPGEVWGEVTVGEGTNRTEKVLLHQEVEGGRVASDAAGGGRVGEAQARLPRLADPAPHLAGPGRADADQEERAGQGQEQGERPGPVEHAKPPADEAVAHHGGQVAGGEAGPHQAQGGAQILVPILPDLPGTAQLAAARPQLAQGQQGHGPHQQGRCAAAQLHRQPIEVIEGLRGAVLAQAGHGEVVDEGAIRGEVVLSHQGSGLGLLEAAQQVRHHGGADVGGAAKVVVLIGGGEAGECLLIATVAQVHQGLAQRILLTLDDLEIRPIGGLGRLHQLRRVRGLAGQDQAAVVGVVEAHQGLDPLAAASGALKHLEEFEEGLAGRGALRAVEAVDIQQVARRRGLGAVDKEEAVVLRLVDQVEGHRLRISICPVEGAAEESRYLGGEAAGGGSGPVHGADGVPAVAGEIAAAQLLDAALAMLDLGLGDLAVLVSQARAGDSALVQADGLFEGIAPHHTIPPHDLHGEVDELGVVLAVVAAQLPALLHAST
jgi:Domain of unknown function (DUF4340)